MQMVNPQPNSSSFNSFHGPATIAGMDINSGWEMRDYPLLIETRKACELGITQHQLLRSGRYPSVLAGVRMDRERLVQLPTPIWADRTWQWDSLSLRAALVKHPEVVAAHALAARLYGWPLPSNFTTDQIFLWSPDRNARINQRRITLRRKRNFAHVKWFGLPLLSPADTFIDIGPDLTERDLIKLGDAAVGNWHGPPQISLESLRAAVGERSRIRSRRHLLNALDKVRTTVDSPRETDLRLWTVAVGLPEPTVHPRIACSTRRGYAEPDLGYEDVRLALEYEGDHHRSSKVQWSRDVERDEALRDAGWTVLKVTSRTNYRQLEEKIRRQLGPL